ncbi:MAG: Gfo/Idh/MocA family oxidoreductase, partial [Chloroflexota bacterium]|nr:Gfo/Idh/MocA family oxidoreductase [Chloroflexota bacterium]
MSSKSKTLGLGVLGCGDAARNIYLPGIRGLEPEGTVRLAALCDQDEQRLYSAATAYPGSNTYVDYNRMLEDPDVDVVVNLTPMQAHAACTMQAIAAGKHVYSEKPVATRLEDANSILEAAGEKGVKVACAPVIMLHPE